MKIHELKIKDEYMISILLGVKRFELRKNDRNYQFGELIKFIPEKMESPNLYKITYILKDVPEYGLADGYCILGIEEYK